MPCFTFFKEALSSFRQLGTFLPTQSHLARTIARNLPRRDGLTIIELGAGEGSITRAIVRELDGMEYRMLVIEMNGNLLRANRRTLQSRNGRPGAASPKGHLTFVHEDAFALERTLKEHQVAKVDAIISTLPLYYFAAPKRKQLFTIARDRLGRHGLYLQYRYTPNGREELALFFSHIQRRFVLNFLPAWLFVCHNCEPRVPTIQAMPNHCPPGQTAA